MANSDRLVILFTLLNRSFTFSNKFHICKLTPVCKLWYFFAFNRLWYQVSYLLKVQLLAIFLILSSKSFTLQHSTSREWWGLYESCCKHHHNSKQIQQCWEVSDLVLALKLAKVSKFHAICILLLNPRKSKKWLPIS